MTRQADAEWTAVLSESEDVLKRLKSEIAADKELITQSRQVILKSWQFLKTIPDETFKP